MGQSLVLNYVHIVFSTKNREDLIKPDIENELFKYLGGVCNSLNCRPLQIGGYLNHVHILCSISKNISIAELIKKTKANSSKWIKSKGQELDNFYWQKGYGAFSLNPTQINLVVDYIKNQKEHHKTKTFQEEYRNFLRKYKIEYNEDYVWE